MGQVEGVLFWSLCLLPPLWARWHGGVWLKPACHGIAGRKGTEQPLLWDGNPFNPELSLRAQVPLTHPLPHPLPETSLMPASEDLPSASSQLCSLAQPQAGVHLPPAGRRSTLT